MIAALFVQTGGAYYGMDDVNPWDESRDARFYDGPYPVVAHPPCQRWGRMAKLNYSQHGGEHNRPGNDGGCFAAALLFVTLYGGVLEHPAQTLAWKEYGLTKPVRGCWTRSGEGWVCEVWQSAYGHRANKATWLYYVGNSKPVDMIWDRILGTHRVGHFDSKCNKPTIWKKEVNATPWMFKEILIMLAQQSVRPLPTPIVTPEDLGTQ